MFSKLVDPECNFGEMLRSRIVKIPVKFLLKSFLLRGFGDSFFCWRKCRVDWFKRFMPRKSIIERSIFKNANLGDFFRLKRTQNNVFLLPAQYWVLRLQLSMVWTFYLMNASHFAMPVDRMTMPFSINWGALFQKRTIGTPFCFAK